MIDPVVVLTGATMGGGLALVVAGLTPTVPDLRAVFARLDSPPPAAEAAATGWRARSDLVANAAAARLGVARYRADLHLVGISPATLAFHKVGYALLGLAFPPVLAAVMGLLGLSLPVMLPAVGSLVLAGALFFAPDVDLRRRTARARIEMRRAVCVYLELVALERAADAGTAAALDRAAAIGDGRAFELIRHALLEAQLAGAPPWQGLRQLASRVQVPELEDVADIMRLSGEDGAAVYATLRARAASLRTSLLTAEATAANTASEHMIMPVACLGVVFMALLGYPALARILYG
jgi:Type II secretion system (T2SS), protein F